jgi:integrase
LSFEDWREQKKALEYASEMKAKEASTQPVAKTETVKAFVDTFLAFKLSQAQGGQRSLGRYIQLRSKLNHFSESIGEEKEAISVSWGVALASYYTALLSDIAAEKIGEDTARDKMQVAKQFIKRLYEIGLIDRPRTLDSKDMAISGGAKKIKIPALEKLKEVIDVAPDIYNDFYAIKAWLLLMANCGFTQQDVSDLKQEEVDWKSGTITRKRSKKERKNEEQIPTVCYKLWKETLDALKPYRKSKKTTVFANRDGNPLVRATISESGKGSITDTIAKTYAAWLEDAAETNTKLKSAPSLKRFRKASSNQLKKSRDYRHFFDYFLGHAPKTVGERSYGEEYQPEFDKAVGWIRTEYGYED